MKSRVHPVIIIISGIIICIDLVYIAFIYGHLIQFGGEKSVTSLVYSYKKAVNDGDSEAYLKLVPMCERTAGEKAHVKEVINNYSGNNYDMEYVESKVMESSTTARGIAKMFLINPFNSPYVSETRMITVRVKGEDTRYLSLMVYKINGRYFIDDVDIE